MLAPVDAPLLQALRLEAPCRIADLGCGGGGSTARIRAAAPAGSVVHGFDIAPSSIEVARARTPSEAAGLAFHVADVAREAPPEGPYGSLASRFGVMFYDDPPAAFANLAGWLAPGGRFAFAVWSLPAENPWFTTVRETVSEVAELPPLDPEAPGAFRYAEAGKLCELLARSGFRDLEVRDWRGTLPVAGGLPAAGAARYALSAFSTFGEHLARAGDGAFDAAHRILTERFAPHERDGVVRLAAGVHVVAGAAP